MAVQEEEHKCEEFDQHWIFTYGDMVTLLLVFFVLLLTFCKTDTESFKSVAESFKPTPPGTPFFLEGQPAVLENFAQQADTSELAEETYVTIDDRGVAVSFKDSALFGPASAELLPDARKSLEKFLKFLFALPNDVVIEGHTDNTPIRTEQFPSNWELSSARASSVARFFEAEGLEGNRITVVGYADNKPRFRNDVPEQRVLNRRIEVIIKPD